MKILHFFERSKFLGSYLLFLKRNYNLDDHHFILWEEYQIKIDLDEDLIREFHVRNISRSSIFEAQNAVNLCNDYDLIILHSLFLPVNLMVCLSINRKYLSKTIWVIWGGDLGNYIGKIDLKRKIWGILRNRIIRKIGYVVTTNIEYNLLVANYSVKPIQIKAFYPYLAEQISMSNEKTCEDSDIRIFLGNYATKANRHIETLHFLSKFKTEPLKIYIPLSYGDLDYAKEVISVANQIFGEKVIILNKFINREDYGKLLSTMDIGIINSVKQIALGSIFSLLLSETKIYTDPHGFIWDIISREQGMKLYPIDKIQNCTFEGFIRADHEVMLANKNKALTLLSNENFKQQWDDVFNIQEKQPI
jgi:hypothetical protein